MAYQYNAVGSAPKILGQTFIVDNLDKLADNILASRWGCIKIKKTNSETFTGTIVPHATSGISTTSSLGSYYPSGSTSATVDLELSSCVVDGKTYYGSKKAGYLVWSVTGNSISAVVDQTIYCLIYKNSTQTIELMSNTYTSAQPVNSGNNASNVSIISVPKEANDIVLALWCEETA